MTCSDDRTVATDTAIPTAPPRVIALRENRRFWAYREFPWDIVELPPEFCVYNK